MFSNVAGGAAAGALVHPNADIVTREDPKPIARVAAALLDIFNVFNLCRTRRWYK